MKATLDIPENLYRYAKLRASPKGTPEWFGLAHAHARNAPRHDMASVRKSIESARRRNDTQA